jgi:hypothetical protein
VFQYTYEACIPEICGGQMGLWESYISTNGCCAFGLFFGCLEGDPVC